MHLPVFLHPDEELLLEYEGKGGIFSGSAIPLPIGNQQSSKTGLRMFYTDNNGVRTPPEFQRTTVSSNGIWVDGPSEKMPIQTPPGQNLTSDFRVRSEETRCVLKINYKILMNSFSSH